MQGLQILHLEDDTLDAELVHREVARLDIQSRWVTVSSSEQFFDAIENTRFDAILSDNRVPGTEGLQALEIARQRRPGMPFIFVSGNTDPRWAEHCLAAGATDYVPKDQLFRLPSALRRLHDAREAERLAALTRGRALLVDLVKELSLARSTDAIVRIVRRGARELNQADGATIVMREGDFCHYVDEDAIGPLWKGSRFPLDACISGWAMLNRQSVAIPDIYQDPRIPHDAYRPTFVKSLVMVPIRRSKPIGAIGTYWATQRRPSDATVRLLQALADSTSVAMENVELVSALESRIASRTEQLEAVNRELEAFSYAVSHDLRAPLRAIKGFSQILLEDHAGALAEGKLHLDRISGAATRMNDLIDDLLQLSKMARSALVRGPFDVAQLAREIVDELRQAEPARRVEIAVPAELPAQGDARLVRVLLENLLRNAWKFTAKRDVARIEVGLRDGAWFVRDNGAGFDAQRAGKLFQPFQRMHTAAEFEGTGIGLATAQRIVRRHGGRIWADSAPNEGATFFFTLS